MAHIEPFRAFRYDPARVSPADVITQPYDKITPEMQEKYYAASPYNLVRVILGKQHATDHSGDNTYTRAAHSFQSWRKEGVLKQDGEPSLYAYWQKFTVPGSSTELERKGFIALGKIEEYAAGVVYRHEQTLSKPKADRLDLLRATRAHFGQIFMLYSDPSAEIENALASPGQPALEMHDEYGVLHRVWKVSDPRLIALVQDKMRNKKLIIADGHHRYETALNYRNERRAAAPDKGPAPYDLLMMTFVNMDSPGLLILPTHRVVHGLSGFSPDALRAEAGKYFSVEEADPTLDAVRAQGILRESGRVGSSLLAVMKDRVFLLSKPKAAGQEIFGDYSLQQQSLDVVQLHKCLLEKALGLSEESIRNQENLRYIRSAAESIELVRSGKANVAFLMNAARMEQIRDIAFANQVMPQKSTDFYPKLLTGVTVYALE
ncbi:MAG: DUF1015 domain-containing protein [Acidobacteria bacterium]|nr:DUF1015 domain-containing protein [Acidobacteriota bacterium]